MQSPPPILLSHAHTNHRFNADGNNVSSGSVQPSPPVLSITTQGIEPKTNHGSFLEVPGVHPRGRKSSNAAHTGATADSSDVDDQQPQTPSSTLALQTYVGSLSDTNNSCIERAAGQTSNHTNQPRPDTIRNKTADPRPFPWKPEILASLVDPKNLRELESMGGENGLLKGLGTDSIFGLSHQFQGGVSAGEGSDSGKDDPYSATLEDRKRVYGDNILPQRKSKTMLHFMWLALGDTSLVRIPILCILQPSDTFPDPSTHRSGNFTCAWPTRPPP